MYTNTEIFFPMIRIQLINKKLPEVLKCGLCFLFLLFFYFSWEEIEPYFNSSKRKALLVARFMIKRQSLSSGTQKGHPNLQPQMRKLTKYWLKDAVISLMRETGTEGAFDSQSNVFP